MSKEHEPKTSYVTKWEHGRKWAGNNMLHAPDMIWIVFQSCKPKQEVTYERNVNIWNSIMTCTVLVCLFWQTVTCYDRKIFPASRAWNAAVKARTKYDGVKAVFSNSWHFGRAIFNIASSSSSTLWTQQNMTTVQLAKDYQFRQSLYGAMPLWQANHENREISCKVMYGFHAQFHVAPYKSY